MLFYKCKFLLEEKEEIRLQRNINFLRNFPFFKKIPMENVKSIYLYCEIKSISFNTILYKQDDEANFFYMIKSGLFMVILSLLFTLYCGL